MKKLERRTFLRAGALALGLPWLPSLAGAAPEDGPCRILFMLGSCGVVPEQWFPAETGNNFTLPYSLAPLEPFKSQMSVVHGVENASARSQGGNAHTKAGAHTLTGARHIEGQFTKAGGGGFSTDISIDQLLAQRLGGGVPSLVTGIDIGVGANGETPRRHFSYSGNNQPVNPIGQPRDLFDTLATFTTSGMASEQAREEILRTRAQRRSVLDLAMGDIRALESRLSAVDRARLDQHLTHLQSLESSIAQLPDPESATACLTPATPDNEGSVLERTRKTLDLIAFAFKCDISRVATFQWAGAQSAIRYDFLDNVPKRSHHQISHNNGAEYNDPMREIAKFHAAQVRHVAALLESYPEGDGTVLDRTIIVHMNTLNRGNTHNFRDLPVVMLGGKGALKQGVSLKLGSGRTLNDLYMTLAQALGTPISTFGDPANVNGVLGALLA